MLDGSALVCVCNTVLCETTDPSTGRMLLPHWGCGFKCCCASAAGSEKEFIHWKEDDDDLVHFIGEKQPCACDRRQREGRSHSPLAAHRPTSRLPGHRDTALAHASARENPSESPEHNRRGPSFFTQRPPSSVFAQERTPSALAGRRGPVPLGGLRAGRRHVGGRRGGTACPKMAAASQVPCGAGWGRGGQLPNGKGGGKVCADSCCYYFYYFKNIYYFTIFHTCPEPVNLKEMGGRFRCWLSVAKTRWGYRQGCAGAFGYFGAILEHPDFAIKVQEFHFHEF